MIKSIYNITVEDVVLLQETKSGKHLKSRFIPNVFLRRGLERLTSQIFERLGTRSIEELRDEYDKLFAIRNLQKMEALWKALDAEINTRTELNTNLLLIGKPTIESKTLNKIIEKIKGYGIDIKSISDIEKFKKKIEFVTDTYLENFPEKKDNAGSVDFVEVIYSTFRYMNEPYNEKMRFLSFLTMKKIAEDLALKDSIKNNG
jgi:hypothetical protein